MSKLTPSHTAAWHAEAVKWLSQSGVTLSPDNPDVADFSGLAKTLEGLMSEKEGHSYL